MTEPNEQPRNEAGVEMNLARHGKLSYVQIPAADAVSLGAFYRDVFGWWVGDNPAHVSFRDTTGELIGAFVTDRAISREPGFLPYVYVDGIDSVLELIRTNGGEIERGPYAEEALWVATFRDPAGNVMGVWTSGTR